MEAGTRFVYGRGWYSASRESEVKLPPKQDEWMTSLPPERKPGAMPMHSTTFSRTTKEGHGDTSAWTDTHSDRAQKARANYLPIIRQPLSLLMKKCRKILPKMQLWLMNITKLSDQSPWFKNTKKSLRKAVR